MGVILDSLDMAVIDFHRRCSMAIMPKVLIFFGFCGEKYSQEMNFQDYKLNMRHTRSHFLVLLMAVLDPTIIHGSGAVSSLIFLLQPHSTNITSPPISLLPVASDQNNIITQL